MKKLTISLLAVLIFAMISCEKEDTRPSKLSVKDQLKECKKCDGGWDLTDTIP